MKAIIIGGVAGGASAAARLRRLDETAEIIIIERGDYISFANCGLPYFIGGEINEKSKLTLQTPESFKARFNIDVRVNNNCISIDTAKKSILCENLTTGERYTEDYDKLLLAPGAEPIKPPIPGFGDERVFTLRNITDALKIKAFVESNRPKSVVIIGGGYIGVEMAENLKKAGLDVTIAELTNQVITPLDFDMAVDVHRYLRSKGINLALSNGVSELVKEENGLTVKLSRGELHTDFVIASIGVKPESGLARACGLDISKRGAIKVDSHMKTSNPDIYAVGDAAEVRDFVTDLPAFIPLAGPANKQGRIAADNICGIPSEYKGTQGSSVLRVFDLTCAMTGLNEKSAVAAGIDYDKTYIYSGSHASYFPGATNMSIKALWDRNSHKLIGAQIIGFDGVDKRMDVIATALRLGAKVTDFTELELCYAPPFGSAKDPVNMLGFVAENIISGKLKQFFPSDVEALPRDGSITLLDVRTPLEVKRGKIDGFMNIPLDTLRDNIKKLPKGRPVYVHCHSGLRSYIACRILTGLGYDCHNLAGGWRLYESVINEKAVEYYVCTDCK